MGAHEGVRGDSQGVRGPPALRAARRPAVRERRHPHRPRGQQDPQGHHRQEQDARGLRRALRAGLGLPRHADRSADREDARQEPVGGGNAAPRARLRHRADRQAARAVQAARRAGRMGPSVPDDGVQERGGRNPHARQGPREGLRLSGPEARQLVLRLPERARRGRGRVRGSRRQRDRCRLPARSAGPREVRRRVRLAGSAGRRHPRGDLDDDAVDDSRQPGAERASRLQLCAGRHTARASRARRGPGRVLPQALRPHRLDRGHGARRGARAAALPASVLRPRVAGVPGRLRDAGAGHGHRALVAGLRRRRLPVVPPLRHEGRRHAEPGAGRRPVRGKPAVLRRPVDLEGQSAHRRQAARGGRAAAHREVHAQLHALLAAQDADHLSRDHAVVRRDGRRARLQRAGSRPSRCAKPRCAASKPRRSIRRGARRGCTA